MSRDQHPGEREDEPEGEDYYDDQPRSIFAALWFRALLAVLVLGVLAAVVVPYMLDFATHSASDNAPAKGPVSTASPAVTPSTAQPAAKTSAAGPAPSAAVAASTSVPAPAASAPPMTAAPSSPPAAAAEPTKTSDTAPATAQPARTTTATVRPAMSTTRSEPTATRRPRMVATKAAAVAKVAEGATSDGAYWVQVGAFKDAETAKRLVTQLRGQGFRAESTASGGKPVAAPVASDAPG